MTKGETPAAAMLVETTGRREKNGVLSSGCVGAGEQTGGRAGRMAGGAVSVSTAYRGTHTLPISIDAPSEHWRRRLCQQIITAMRRRAILARAMAAMCVAASNSSTARS